MRVTEIAAFVNEREAIRLRKATLESGVRVEELRPHLHEDVWPRTASWTLDHLTDDPILRAYRFCNIRRQDDRVTRWIIEHISQPYADHEYLWFMLAIARTFNWPPTLELLLTGDEAWPDRPRFGPSAMTDLVEYARFAGELPKLHTGAYMIRAESDPKAEWYSWPKVKYLCEVVLGRLWTDRHDWQTYMWDRPDGGLPSLEAVWETFQEPQYVGWGPFMAYQVVVDLRWTRYLSDAKDIQTWATLGPGSRRGLNRLYGRRVDHPLKQNEGLQEMLELRERLAEPGVLADWVGGVPDLSDVQNVLCEWDKYQRVMLGEGRPRALYVPGRGS